MLVGSAFVGTFKKKDRGFVFYTLLSMKVDSLDMCRPISLSFHGINDIVVGHYPAQWLAN